MHGESDSRKTAFIEPEETIELNNELFSLEQDELKEVQRVLRQLTAQLAPYSSLLLGYLQMAGLYDFIKAKALLAIDMNAHLPVVENKATSHLIQAYHPLLYMYNKASGKKTIPVNLELDDEARILIISGPNAGGKTVSMKTLGLNQVMLQSGLLVPVHPDSQMGIYKQLFIQLGDTQNLAFELSTYSSHLTHMKYFIENANADLFEKGLPTTSKEMNDAVQPVTRKVKTDEENVNTNNFGGFVNFSIGKEMRVNKRLNLSVEPYVKLPVGSFKRADMNYTNGGIRIITNF